MSGGLRPRGRDLGRRLGSGGARIDAACTEGPSPPDGPRLSGDELVVALTVAMAVAPGVYPRNKHFSLHLLPETKAAKRRAALLRGIVRHLGRACNTHVSRLASGRVRLSYRVPALSFERSTELSPEEAACLRYLARRSGFVPPEEAGCPSDEVEDRLAVEWVLVKLGPRVGSP